MSTMSNRAKPSAGSETVILEIPDATVNGLIDLRLHNQGGADDVITVWITHDTDTTTDADIIDEVTLKSKETYSDNCGHAKAGEMVIVKSANGTTSVRVTALVE